MLVRVFYDMHLREFLVDQDFCAYKTTREPIDRSSKLLPFSNLTSGIKIKRSVITGMKIKKHYSAIVFIKDSEKV